MSNAVLLGGILVGLMDVRPRVAGERPSARPLVVELLPLAAPVDGTSQAHVPVAQARPQAATAQTRRASGVVEPLPTIRLRPAAALAGSGAAVAAKSDSAERGSRASDFSEYQRRLYEAIARHSRYPAEARRSHLAGVTTLAFTIDRGGGVVEAWIQKSSGSDMLDNAALEALERASPLPAIPMSLPARSDFVIELDLSVLQQSALQTVG